MKKASSKEKKLREKTNNSSEKTYQQLKFDLENLQKKKKGILFIAGTVFAFFGFIIYFAFIDFEFDKNVSDIVFSILFAFFFGILGIAFALLWLDTDIASTRREMLPYETEDIQNKVQEDVFENSLKMSYKYLDQYYLQTREQAQKGFVVTVCISIFGAFLLGIGILAMFFEKTKPSYVTCASGIITEFIAAIFFYLYNKTVTSMSKYHNKLVLSQNISIALKIANKLPKKHMIKSKVMIISELLRDINTYLIKSDLTDDDKSKSG